MQEYIVTLKKGSDLEKFYDEMETPGGCSCVPDREVVCCDRRPISRNTGYLLTEDEVEALKNDERVIDVVPKSLIDSITIRPLWTQTSEDWEKISTAYSVDKNWGLLRCVDGVQTPNWGENGTSNISGTVTTTSSGKNVDVLVVDGHLNANHPEFAVNDDGTGGTRVQQFNWLSLTNQVTGGSNGTYTYRSGAGLENSEDNHGQHVAGTVSGNTQGWARDATIYYVSPYDGQISADRLFEYIRAWHNQKSINPETGRRNPTICNNSWGSSYTLLKSYVTSIMYRGVSYTSPFSDADLESYGIRDYNATNIYPLAYISAYVADIEDCIDDGIIMVGAAGNESTKIDVQGGDDYDNYILYGGSSSYYYHRGSWNTSCARSGVGGQRLSICVGAVSALVNESKATFSNCGPRVDVYSPGRNIISALHPAGSGVSVVDDPRDSAYKIGKYQGTSMASPQVCGVLACLLEQYPNMNQGDIEDYLIQHYKTGQMTTTSGGYTDDTDLQGSENAYLFYKKERVETGVATPKYSYNTRKPDENGTKYPRVNTMVTKTV